MPTNFATSDAGAVVASSSSEGSHVASSVSNLLLGRTDLLWLAGDAPQQVTLELKSHPPLRYVGWHVWHDYLTNPEVVEIHSGVLADRLSHTISCTALQGAGTQLWELENPIPESHRFVSFKIASTFAPGPTYINHLCLFAEHPGSDFAAQQATVNDSAVQPPHQGDESMMSPNPMSALLRELDEDIRMLHPIKAVSPSKTKLLATNPIPLPEQQQPPQQRNPILQPAAPVDGGSGSSARLDALERSMMTLQRTVEAQTHQIQQLTSVVAKQSQTTRSESHRSERADFPEDALREFVEEIVSHRLQKHTKRSEAKLMQRIDDQLHGIMKEVMYTANEKVSQRIHEIALDESHPYKAHSRRHPSATHFGK